jgi:hypothetical protein
MPDVKISQLPAGTANASAVVPATNAAGTTTEKITLESIVGLIADQSLFMADSVTFNSVTLPNYTQVVVGSFDNSTGGQSGLSLICAVGYELNWQGGRLKNVYNNATQTIFIDSPIEFPGVGADNVSVDSVGITFADGTTLTTANPSNVVVSPAEITADQNDYSLPTADVVRLSASAARNVTGFAAGSSGRALLLVNVGSFAITLKHQSTSSSAANRLVVPWAGDYVMDANGGAALVIYDATTQRWRVV